MLVISGIMKDDSKLAAAGFEGCDFVVDTPLEDDAFLAAFNVFRRAPVVVAC